MTPKQHKPYTKHLSIVIQGPVVENNQQLQFGTVQVCRAWRTLFPYAQIVLSTWKQYKDSSNLCDVDTIVTSDDPGPTLPPQPAMGYPAQNHNRMIMSTKRGLEACTNEFVIKARTDILPCKFELEAILRHSRRLPRLKKHSLLEDRIGVLEKVSFNSFAFLTTSHLRQPRCRHLSDIVQCGARSDLLEYWSAPLIKHIHHRLDGDALTTQYQAMDRPESYLFHRWVIARRVVDSVLFSCDRPYHIVNTKCEHILFANFFIVSHKHAAFTMPAHIHTSKNKDDFTHTAFTHLSRLEYYTNGLAILILSRMVCLKLKLQTIQSKLQSKLLERGIDTLPLRHKRTGRIVNIDFSQCWVCTLRLSRSVRSWISK
jgi:hypothetical protein